MDTPTPRHHQPDQPATGLAHWMREGGGGGEGGEGGHASGPHPTWPWYRVLWLTGVDYFSTLGYQPGIALLAAGALAPLATGVLVLVTLFGALPIYREVAHRSYRGHGSISMLERLLPGWLGKVFVLALIGFASTDFVITMTLSAADAAQHAVENPFLSHVLEGQRTPLTIGLLALLAVVFIRGFREAIGLATWLALPYLALNAVVIGRGLWEVYTHPDLMPRWTDALSARGDPGSLAVLALLVFPKLALGLSGFETGVTVMPVVKGSPDDPQDGPPLGRIRATSHLLTAAALIMSVFLIGSSFVTTVVIPEAVWSEGGEASGRALAWIAHHYMGSVFGTIYDVSTILILWFAGASAMAAMLSLIPRYLPRFGMAPHWVSFPRPLILTLFGIDVLVTLVFDSDVEAQGGAYATGVLALILSASVAVALANWHEAREARQFPWKGIAFWAISGLFTFTLVDNVHARPDGLIISTIFIVAILLLGAISRWQRATEFRVERIAFANRESEKVFQEIKGKKVHIIAVKHTDTLLSRHKANIRNYYRLDGPVAYLHIDLSPDRSLFDSTVYLKVGRVGEEDFRISATNAVAIANTIAYISELLDPRSIFLGLTRENPMGQALRYLVWGEGETGILVYQILLKYWNWTPEDDVRPRIFLMSD